MAWLQLPRSSAGGHLAGALGRAAMTRAQGHARSLHPPRAAQRMAWKKLLCHTSTRAWLHTRTRCPAPPPVLVSPQPLPPTAGHRALTSASEGAKATATPPSWVDSLPESVRPYLYLIRADKPIGTWLLLWPCCWSIAIAAPAGALPDFFMMAKFAAGAVVMRGAGCTINDMWDKDIDNKVVRTRSRPIAAGVISSQGALVFLAGQLTVGLGVLVSLNMYSIVLGAASMGLVVIYPAMKRYTHWPQLVLGLTFNWGALLGASAVLGTCPWEICLPMYAGSVAWTIVYDTIYAHQDKADDVKVGVRSTALLFAEQTKPILSGFSACFIGGLYLAGSAAGLGPAFHGSLCVASAHVGWQLATVNLDDPSDCMAKFKSNSLVGAIIAVGVIAGKLWV